MRKAFDDGHGRRVARFPADGKQLAILEHLLVYGAMGGFGTAIHTTDAGRPGDLVLFPGQNPGGEMLQIAWLPAPAVHRSR